MHFNTRAQYYVRCQLPFGKFSAAENSSRWTGEYEFRNAFIGNLPGCILHMQFQAPLVENRLFVVPEFGCGMAGSGVKVPSGRITADYYTTKSISLNVALLCKFQLLKNPNSPFFYAGAEVNVFPGKNLILLSSSPGTDDRLRESFMPASVCGAGYSFLDGFLSFDLRYTYGFNGLGLNLHLDELKVGIISLGFLIRLGS